jgi:flagellar P-ring protein precursor FlgI
MPRLPRSTPIYAVCAAAAVLAALLLFARPARADRLSDLCDVVGVRDNQLLGYGVVTGLQGTGDDINAPFGTQSLLALMRRLGIQIDTTTMNQIRLRNVAAVVVTANIPAFAKPGAHLDATVSSIGNARSLQGGVLLQSMLLGADAHPYAVAQGPIAVGGFEARGASGTSVRQNTTNTARVPGGAIVEREITTDFAKNDVITLALRDEDFRTAQRIVTAVDAALGEGSATAMDAGAIRVKAPDDLKGKPVELLSKISDIDISVATVARVVINERTGTIVAGGDVHLSPVAIAYGGLTIVIREQAAVSQPQPFSRGGKTVVTPQSDVTATEGAPSRPTMTFVQGAASLADVAHALATLGVTPRELASILQALRTAGALRAEVVMQ